MDQTMIFFLFITRFDFPDIAFIALNQIGMLASAVRTDPAVFYGAIFLLAVLAECNAFDHFNSHLAVF